MPPELDDQGEIVGVQEFDVEAFLATIPQAPQCPRCFTGMTFGSNRIEDGSQWDYYRCPMTRFFTSNSCGSNRKKQNCMRDIKKYILGGVLNKNIL